MKRLVSSDPTSTTRGSSIISQAASAIARESPRRRLRSTKPRPDPVPVVLSDSEDDDGDSDDDDHAPASTPSKTDEGDDVAILGSSFAAGDEDDEFADYIRKAEEQRRNQALTKVSQNSAGAPKECIQILITSTLPNINPFRVKFLYDRPLRLVKDTWLAMQTSRGLLRDLEDTNDIIMTWKKKKIYVSSTILNLGIRPPAKSPLDMDGLSTAGLDDNSTMHVHFEVWTKAQFEEMERAEESWQRKRDAGELSDDDDSLDHLPEEPAVPEAKLRVVLKSRGLPDVKLTVRPETTVETLITGFQTQQASAVGKDVGIWFDGDRLEEHMTMEEVEIDDLDTLEVHVK